MSKRLSLSCDIIWKSFSELSCIKKIKIRFASFLSEICAEDFKKEIRDNHFADLIPEAQKLLKRVFLDEKWDKFSVSFKNDSHRFFSVMDFFLLGFSVMDSCCHGFLRQLSKIAEKSVDKTVD